MTYQDFNSRIAKFYLQRSNTSYCSLTIDKGSLESIIAIEEIRSFKELTSCWNFLLRYENGIPLYLGLLAVQCYAAYLMNNDGLNSSDAYKIRLTELLGLKDNFVLQGLFVGSHSDNPIQEQIWMDAKNYFLQKFNQELDIPERSTHAGRFVQYPKSQSLLTIEDLKSFTPFFHEHFIINEEIPFTYFENRLVASLNKIKQTKRCRDLLIDADKKLRCIKQIFECFIVWDGSIQFDNKSEAYKKDVKPNEISLNKNRIILMFLNETPNFYIDDENNVLQKIDPNVIFDLHDYKYFHEELLLFNELEYYINEFEDCRFIYRDTIFYVLTHKMGLHEIINDLERISQSKEILNDGLILYRCKADSGLETSSLKKYLQSRRPLKLDGGLRLDRSKTYISGFGPTIKTNVEYSILFEGNSVDYFPATPLCGDFIVRMRGYEDYRFSIVQIECSSSYIKSSGWGWNLKNYETSSEYDLEGINLKKPIPNHESLVRQWINANLKREYDGNKILLKTIARKVQ